MSAVQWRVGGVLRHAWSRCARGRLAAVFQITTTNFAASTDSVDACRLFSGSSLRSSPPAPTSPSVPTIPFEIHSRECASGFVQTALSRLPWRSRSLQTRRLARQDSPDKVKAFIVTTFVQALRSALSERRVFHAEQRASLRRGLLAALRHCPVRQSCRRPEPESVSGPESRSAGGRCRSSCRSD